MLLDSSEKDKMGLFAPVALVVPATNGSPTIAPNAIARDSLAGSCPRAPFAPRFAPVLVHAAVRRRGGL